MSKFVKPLFVAICTGAAVAVLSAASPVQASPSQLSCNSPFKKVQTNANSIQCKWAYNYGPNGRNAAEQRARQLRPRASCNAHSSPPVVKVWKKYGTDWSVRVTFICANIT